MTYYLVAAVGTAIILAPVAVPVVFLVRNMRQGRTIDQEG